MKHLAFSLATCLLALSLAAQSASKDSPDSARKAPATQHAPLPQRDLTLEVREVEAADAGYSVGTQPARPLLTAQQVQVRNGETASLVLAQTVPMRWLQSAQAQNTSLAASGVSANSTGGGVAYAMSWLQAGQSVRVAPRWSGGNEPAVVELEIEAASLAERGGAELPTRTQQRAATTLTLPLGQWVTVASSGQRAQAGVYGSAAAQDRQRLLQMRVLVAP